MEGCGRGKLKLQGSSRRAQSTFRAGECGLEERLKASQVVTNLESGHGPQRRADLGTAGSLSEISLSTSLLCCTDQRVSTQSALQCPFSRHSFIHA